LRIAGPAGRITLALPGRSDANHEDPAISPDGRLIALRLAPTSQATATTQDIWLLDRQQETLERFTVGGGYAPVWSRDGRLIAYSAPDSGPQGPAGLYVRAADQTDAPRLLLRGTQLYAGSWLADGRTLLFQAMGRSGTSSDIGSITLGDSVPRWIVATEFREVHPQVSRDGRWLAYASNRTGRDEVYVQPLAGDGGRVQVSTDDGSAPRWSRDGRTLYYVQGASIVAVTLAPGPGIRAAARRVVVEGGVTDLNASNVNWDLFPDGRGFLHIDLTGGGAIRPVWILNWPALASGSRTGS
jgi:Tol biopolymer transport system component